MLHDGSSLKVPYGGDRESNTAHTHQVTVRTRTMLAVVRMHEHLTSIYVCVSNPMYKARECCTMTSRELR